jgi:hypothetical protein
MMGGFKNEGDHDKSVMRLSSVTKLSCRYVNTVLPTFLEHVIINIPNLFMSTTKCGCQLYHSIQIIQSKSESLVKLLKLQFGLVDECSINGHFAIGTCFLPMPDLH